MALILWASASQSLICFIVPFRRFLASLFAFAIVNAVSPSAMSGPQVAAAASPTSFNGFNIACSIVDVIALYPFQPCLRSDFRVVFCNPLLYKKSFAVLFAISSAILGGNLGAVSERLF